MTLEITPSINPAATAASLQRLIEPFRLVEAAIQELLHAHEPIRFRHCSNELLSSKLMAATNNPRLGVPISLSAESSVVAIETQIYVVAAEYDIGANVYSCSLRPFMERLANLKDPGPELRLRVADETVVAMQLIVPIVLAR